MNASRPLILEEVTALPQQHSPWFLPGSQLRSHSVTPRLLHGLLDQVSPGRAEEAQVGQDGLAGAASPTPEGGAMDGDRQEVSCRGRVTHSLRLPPGSGMRKPQGSLAGHTCVCTVMGVDWGLERRYPHAPGGGRAFPHSCRLCDGVVGLR